MTTRPKVFGIGFQKTGTKSLAIALQKLGYRVTGPNGFRVPDIAQRYHRICRRYSRAYDAFQDNPWPLTFREMSTMYPDAKFILTIREPISWITSAKAHFGTQTTPMRELIYGVGSPIGNEKTYIDRFQQHEREVREFFIPQKNRLLILRIADGEGYEKLCPFLDHEIPNEPFPWKNRNSPVT